MIPAEPRPPVNTAERINESVGLARVIADRKWKIAKLDAAEKTARAGGNAVAVVLLLFLLPILLLTLNLGLGFLLAELTGLSSGVSFLLLSAFYAVVMLVIYVFRNQFFTNPLLSSLAKKLF